MTTPPPPRTTPTFPRRWLCVAAGLAIVTLAGCSTMRPISSKPPVPKIVLATPFDVRAWSGVLPPLPFHVILPAGEYHPLYEDDQVYYYQAPSKVVVKDLGSALWDGGIYIQRGTTTPTGWYYQDVDSDGGAEWKTGLFKTPPPSR
jgi:hypothetical protein